MKLKYLIKVAYYLDPEAFGYSSRHPFSIDFIYNKVVKHVEVDGECRKIVSNSIITYLPFYRDTIADYVADWYSCTNGDN